MATTTNYSWTTPDDTDLVKNGASAIRALGTAIDTTTKNLNPSTTLGDIEYRSSSANTNTRLGIGTTGQVLTVSGGVPAWTTPATSGFEGCLIWHSANQSLSNNSFTTISFDSEEYDTSGFHSNSTNNSRITIPTGKDGYYFFQGMISWATNATAQRAGRFAVSDGRLYNNFAGAASGSTYGSSIYFATTFYLDAGDYVELRGLQNSGGSLNVESQVYSTFMSCEYLGA
jgi:hypothetical protein